jgi:hypothetical protein
MIRNMGTDRLYLAGRVTAWLTVAVCIVGAALVIGSLAMGKVHPPRAIKPESTNTPG